MNEVWSFVIAVAMALLLMRFIWNFMLYNDEYDRLPLHLKVAIRNVACKNEPMPLTARERCLPTKMIATVSADLRAVLYGYPSKDVVAIERYMMRVKRLHLLCKLTFPRLRTYKMRVLVYHILRRTSAREYRLPRELCAMIVKRIHI